MRKLFILTVICCLFLFLSGCGQEHVILKVGDPAPDFSLIDLDGEKRSLSEFKGKVVFINFWATWCPPCIKELPSMQKLHTMMADKDFVMLALINKDTLEQAYYLADKEGYSMTILDDSKNKVGARYSITGLPETYIVDKQGIVREKFIGPAEWDSPESVKMIMKYIDLE